MKDTPQEGIRKTIYIDEKLFKHAETMYSMADVNWFSAFAAKAIENYIAQLVVKNHGSLLSDEIIKAIDNALSPIDRRMSKALYRCKHCFSEFCCGSNFRHKCFKFFDS